MTSPAITGLLWDYCLHVSMVCMSDCMHGLQAYMCECECVHVCERERDLSKLGGSLLSETIYVSWNLHDHALVTIVLC